MAPNMTYQEDIKAWRQISARQRQRLQQSERDKASPQPTPPRINQNTLPDLTSASAKVFATPELVEHILSYLEAIELYGFRRVSSTFLETTNLPKFRQHMLIDPTNDPEINIPRLKYVIKTHGISETMNPLFIGRMYTINSGQDLCIHVRNFDYWAESFSRGRMGHEELDVRDLPVGNVERSWRHIRLERGDGALKIFFDIICHPSSDTLDRNRGVKEYGSLEEVTLGRVAEDCVEMYYAHKATPWNEEIG